MLRTRNDWDWKSVRWCSSSYRTDAFWESRLFYAIDELCHKAECVTCSTVRQALSKTLSVNHCCRCFRMCLKLQIISDKGRQGKQILYHFCLSAAGTNLPKPPNQLCHSDLTEAVPFKLLLPSCYHSKEEVVSKYVLKYLLLTFLKNGGGGFDLFQRDFVMIEKVNGF